jgi:hypothetical protein
LPELLLLLLPVLSAVKHQQLLQDPFPPRGSYGGLRLSTSRKGVLWRFLALVDDSSSGLLETWGVQLMASY